MKEQINTYALKHYMTELGWSAADLANHCAVYLSTITGLLSGDVAPTYIQIMCIINKLCLEFPPDRHLGIYQSIFNPQHLLYIAYQK